MKDIRAFFRDDRGASAVEYGLVASLIALAIVLSATALGVTINGILLALANALGG